MVQTRPGKLFQQLFLQVLRITIPIEMQLQL